MKRLLLTESLVVLQREAPLPRFHVCNMKTTRSEVYDLQFTPKESAAVKVGVQVHNGQEKASQGATASTAAGRIFQAGG